MMNMDYSANNRKKKEVGYQSRISWIKKRFKEGMKYKLLRVKEGKKSPNRGFIEYIPGKYNWRGINADGFMVIHCIWVVGRHKNQGYASKLLKVCMKDARIAGMHGIVGMSAEKGGWAPKKIFYEKNGLEKVDEFPPYYGLYVKRFFDDVSIPQFHSISKDKLKSYNNGITILYSHQCPYIPHLIDDVKQLAENNNLSFHTIKLQNSKEAQLNQLHPYGTYCITCDGELLSYKPGIRKETLDRLKTKQKGS
jgi:GNAT superfamily N-acetyltransferase